MNLNSLALRRFLLTTTSTIVAIVKLGFPKTKPISQEMATQDAHIVSEVYGQSHAIPIVNVITWFLINTASLYASTMKIARVNATTKIAPF